MATTSSDKRYRCTACGNLTRFEVTATRTTRAFHHYTVGGELSVKDPEVISEKLESVLCRWCGSGENVVELNDADEGTLAADPDEGAGPNLAGGSDRADGQSGVSGLNRGAD